MQVGTIVKWITANDLGIIIDKEEDFGEYCVKWVAGSCSGEDGWYMPYCLEVICK